MEARTKSTKYSSKYILWIY